MKNILETIQRLISLIVFLNIFLCSVVEPSYLLIFRKRNGSVFYFVHAKYAMSNGSIQGRAKQRISFTGRDPNKYPSSVLSNCSASERMSWTTRGRPRSFAAFATCTTSRHRSHSGGNSCVSPRLCFNARSPLSSRSFSKCA